MNSKVKSIVSYQAHLHTIFIVEMRNLPIELLLLKPK